MAKMTSSHIRKIYFKQKKLELKKKLGKGLFAIILSILAILLSDSVLQDEESSD